MCCVLPAKVNPLWRIITTYKPRHDKTKKWMCSQRRHINLGIRPVWSESSLSTWGNIGPLTTFWAQKVKTGQTERMYRLWSDWADARADLTLHWAHSHFVGFVMRRLNWWSNCKRDFLVDLVKHECTCSFSPSLLASAINAGWFIDNVLRVWNHILRNLPIYRF